MIHSQLARCAALAAAAALSLSLAACGKREDVSSGAPSPASPGNPPPAAAVAGSAAMPAAASASAAPSPSAGASAPAQDPLAGAKPLASSTASDAKLESVLSGGSNWRSAKQGVAAKDEYVGFETPAPVQPHELTVRWVAWHWVPAKLAIDDSDDGKTWSPVALLSVKEPSDVKSRMQGLNRWEETYAVPASAGAHRFWRVRAADISETNFFGLERITAR